jgi:hypothetical protein
MKRDTDLPWAWVPVHLGAIALNLWMYYQLAMYGAVAHYLGIMNVPLFAAFVSIWLILFLVLVFTLLHWTFYGDGAHIPPLRRKDAFQ